MAPTDWTYGTNAWRQANADSTNQVEVVIAEAGQFIQVRGHIAAGLSSGKALSASIGIDATSPSSIDIARTGGYTNGSDMNHHADPVVDDAPAAGYHFYALLELSELGTSYTAFGDGGGTSHQSGLSGWIMA